MPLTAWPQESYTVISAMSCCRTGQPYSLREVITQGHGNIRRRGSLEAGHTGCHQIRNPETPLLLSHCPVKESQSFPTYSLAPSPSVFWADGPSGTRSLVVYRPQESPEILVDVPPAHPLCLWEGLPPWEASIQPSPHTYCIHSTRRLCLDAGV